MSFTIPSYLEKAKVHGAKISYTWSKVRKTYNNPVPTNASIRPVGRLSYNAAAALALGIGEWIAWRLDGLSDDKSLFEYLEKGWQTVLKKQPYPKLEGYYDRFDNKPSVAPLYYAQHHLEEALQSYEIQSNGIYLSIVYLKWLAGAVSPSKSAFNSWYTKTVERFTKKFPRKDSDVYGVPVPREELDYGSK